MQADEVGRTRAGFGQARDRQRRGVGREDRVGGNHGFALLRHVGLDRTVFEHRFDHDLRALQQGVVRGRHDAVEQRLPLLLRELAALHLPGDQCLRIRLALLRRVLRPVDQHHLHAGPGRHIGNARAHHAGTEHADPAVLLHRHAGRPPRQLVRLAHAEEQRADHVLRCRRHHGFDEVARLGLQGGIDVGDQAFIHAGQDIGRRRIVAAGLRTQHRIGGHEHLLHGRRRDRTARNPVAPGIPWLLRRLPLREQPVTRGLHLRTGRDDGIENA
ncbi:hypothetical protein D3C81_920090 [compost metagenome]